MQCRYFLAALALMFAATLARAEPVVMGQGPADAAGVGVVQFPVDASQDPELLANRLEGSVVLDQGARLESVGVHGGIATVAFAGAVPGSTVQATLPEFVADNVVVAAGATEEEEETRKAGWWLLGTGGLAGLFGGLAGAGVFDDDGGRGPAVAGAPEDFPNGGTGTETPTTSPGQPNDPLPEEPASPAL